MEQTTATILIAAVAVLAVLTVVLIIVVLMQISKINRLKKRLDRFVSGKNASNLEKEIVSIVEDNKFLKIDMERNKKDIRALEKKTDTCYQKMGLVKYDAFKQMGGQLSFCLALLDDNNDGFIINSVHSIEGCYSYTKELRGGKSNIDLGAEEAEAVKIAMGDKEITK